MNSVGYMQQVKTRCTSMALSRVWGSCPRLVALTTTPSPRHQHQQVTSFRQPVFSNNSTRFFHQQRILLTDNEPNNTPVLPTTDEKQSFKELGIEQELEAILAKMNLTTPTEIQNSALPVIMDGKDVCITAETGSGKTLAYVLPMLQQLLRAIKTPPQPRRRLPHDLQQPYSPRYLILVPTIELVHQTFTLIDGIVSKLPRLYSSVLHIEVFTSSIPMSIALRPDILIATPACITGKLKGDAKTHEFLQNTQTLVIDEADVLLNDSYVNDTTRIFHALFRHRSSLSSSSSSSGQFPKPNDRERQRPRHHQQQQQQPQPPLNRQFIFVGATLPPITTKKSKSPRKFIEHKFPEIQWIETEQSHRVIPEMDETFIDVFDKKDVEKAHSKQNEILKREFKVKSEKLKTYLENEYQGDGRILVFVKTVENAKKLVDVLDSDLDPLRYTVHMLHAKLPREERVSVVDFFIKSSQELQNDRRNDSKTHLLVTTDALSRGVDFKDVALVVQFDFASDASEYLHRIGRGARMVSVGEGQDPVRKSGMCLNYIGALNVRLADFLKKAAKGQDFLTMKMEMDEMNEEEEEDDGARRIKGDVSGLFSRKRKLGKRLKKKTGGFQ